MLYGVSKRSFTGSMKRSGHTGQPTSGSPFLLPTTTAARFSFRRIYPVQPGYQANWQVLVSLTLGFICRRSLDRLQKADDGESALADGLWLVHPLPSRDDWSASAKQWAECQKNENNGKPSGSDRPAPAFPASDKAGLGFRVWAETTYGGSESVMKTVRDACQLQDNALSIKLSDQIEQLDELIGSEGDGAAFFEKTYIRGWITARWFSGFTSELDFCTLPLYANSALQPDPGPNIVPYEASSSLAVLSSNDYKSGSVVCDFDTWKAFLKCRPWCFKPGSNSAQHAHWPVAGFGRLHAQIGVRDAKTTGSPKAPS
jgi:hypothetical protein